MGGTEEDAIADEKLEDITDGTMTANELDGEVALRDSVAVGVVVGFSVGGLWHITSASFV